LAGGRGSIRADTENDSHDTEHRYQGGTQRKFDNVTIETFWRIAIMIRSPISLAENARRGMVTAQIALSMGVLMGMLALLVDGGLMLAERRHAQATADAAALAAASAIYTGSAGSASATTVASDNGYTSSNSTVTVNNPPQSGNFTTAKLGGAANSAPYVEVIVTYNMQRGFSAIFGSGTIPISARAVAVGSFTSGASGLPGILLLGNTGTTVTAKGNGTVDVTDPTGYTGSGGSIYIDSTGPNAVVTTGNASVSAPSVFIAQTGATSSGVTATSGSITTGATQLPDPLSYLPSPATNAPSGVTVNTQYASSGITGSTTLASNTVYIVGGSGISLSGNATLSGTNVMLYITGANASISLTGNGAVNLTPMATGPYAGVIFFQDRSNLNGDDLHGNGNLQIYGTIYAPAANVTATGNGTTDVFASQIISSSLTTKGNGTVNVKFDANNAPTPAIRNLELVE
jgi:Flp pilus assembly protein TadG